MTHAFSSESLYDLRTARGLTQEALALSSGLATATVVKLEGGQVTDPRVSTLQRLAQTLECPLEALLTQQSVREA